MKLLAYKWANSRNYSHVFRCWGA